MGNPSTRVLALLELLQSHGLMSGPALAARLEVDPRTLRRYIQALEALGVPVTAARGRDGGYRLMQGFKLPPMMFSNDEALALALGLVAARGFGLQDAAPAGASALAKLERVMPDKLRRRVRALSETVSLDIGRPAPSGDAEVLATLGEAAQGRQRVRLVYLAADQAQTERELDPYGLAHFNGKWYVVGYCCLRRDIRSFRLDRIRSASLLAASFGKPTGFDAMAYLAGAIASLPRAYQVRVLLHADLASAQAAIVITLGLLEAVAGGTMLHGQADDLDWLARELARLPCSFQIEEPPALRAALARHALRLAASA